MNVEIYFIKIQNSFRPDGTKATGGLDDLSKLMGMS